MRLLFVACFALFAAGCSSSTEGTPTATCAERFAGKWKLHYVRNDAMSEFAPAMGAGKPNADCKAVKDIAAFDSGGELAATMWTEARTTTPDAVSTSNAEINTNPDSGQCVLTYGDEPGARSAITVLTLSKAGDALTIYAVYTAGGIVVTKDERCVVVFDGTGTR